MAFICNEIQSMLKVFCLVIKLVCFRLIEKQLPSVIVLTFSTTLKFKDREAIIGIIIHYCLTKQTEFKRQLSFPCLCIDFDKV